MATAEERKDERLPLVSGDHGDDKHVAAEKAHFSWRALWPNLGLHDWKGIAILPFLITLMIGGVVWPLVPPGLPAKTWHLFVIFAFTIFGIITAPLPVSAVAIVAIAVSLTTRTLPIASALSAFGAPVVWLIVFAFFIARGFIVTGLGKRLCYIVLGQVGQSSLGLAYGLTVAELVLAPAVPSNTARGAAVLLPILQPLLKDAFASDPALKTEKKIGSFLVMVALHANCVTSALYLTGCAASALTARMALSALGVELGWMRWFMAMSVPGVLDVALMPLVLYWAYPPEVRTTPEAPQLAREKLKEMGPLTRKEIIMIGTFVLLIFLWIFGDLFKFIDATSTAIVGVAILLLTGVLDVTQHIITEKAAYDTMLWFATLVMLAGNLTKGGFFDWLSGHVSPTMSKLPWLVAMIVLSLLFYFSHYAFASLTAHTASLFSALGVVAVSAGAPAPVVAVMFAAYSPLSGCLTQYGSGPSPAYFATGYVSVVDWWRVGLIVSAWHLLVFNTVGLLWWKVIGLM